MPTTQTALQCAFWTLLVPRILLSFLRGLGFETVPELQHLHDAFRGQQVEEPCLESAFPKRLQYRRREQDTEIGCCFVEREHLRGEHAGQTNIERDENFREPLLLSLVALVYCVWREKRERHTLVPFQGRKPTIQGLAAALLFGLKLSRVLPTSTVLALGPALPLLRLSQYKSSEKTPRVIVGSS